MVQWGVMVQLQSFLKRSENLIFENVKTYNLLLLQSYFERILNLRFVEQLSPVEAENFEIECIQTKQSTRVPKGKLNSNQRKAHTKREIALQSYDFEKAVIYKFDTNVNIKVTCANCKICMNELKTVSSSIRKENQR